MPSIGGHSVDHYDYPLPEHRIAQQPVEPRDAARLLVDRGPGRTPDDRTVNDLPDLLGPGDVLVLNDTRVRPARLRLRKETGGQVELLLLQHDGRREFSALLRPARRLRVGTVLHAEDGPVAEVIAAGAEGWRVRLLGETPVEQLASELGEMPLPPYIHRRLGDPDRYQTVYADRVGSAAAPTAGLHLTEALLTEVRQAGAAVHTVELQVGLDTFRPLQGTTLDDQVMHTERYAVPDSTAEAVRGADRVIAVGTTTVRALESAARGPSEGSTDLFIRPGFDFRSVDTIMTNFHVPRSTLLVMIEAFVGERWRDLYAHALGGAYRFLSFGDAMFLPIPDRRR